MSTTFTISVAQFRLAFPEFSNTGNYPDGQISFWAGIAQQMINGERFGSSAQLASMLFIAHNIALERMNQIGAIAGIPGLNTGAISGQTGGATTVSYDTASSTIPGAGHWNLTTYGTRFQWMVRMAGAGPVQVGLPNLAGLVVEVGLGLAGPGWGYYQGGPYWAACQ